MPATISPVRICNMALSHIGARSRIETLSEQSAEAKECSLWYDYSRLATLEGFDWSFARKRLQLALAGDPPLDDTWCFRYQYPVDCVAAREIVNPSLVRIDPGYNTLLFTDRTDAIPFEVEISDDGTANTILTNQPEAILKYTFDQEQTSIYSPYFVKAFSRHLASQIAYALTGKVAIADRNFEVWQLMMIRASGHNANERVGEPERDADTIRGRN